MKKIVTAFAILMSIQTAIAQTPTQKTLSEKNPVLLKETQVLKTISGAVKQLKPDNEAKTYTAPLKQIASDCIDVMYYADDPADEAFFKLLEQEVTFKWSYTEYSFSTNGKTQTVPMKLLIVKFSDSVNTTEAAGTLAPCYCLPNNYVIPFYSNNGWFISFEPNLSQFTEARERTKIYNALQQQLKAALTGFTYQNVSLWNND